MLIQQTIKFYGWPSPSSEPIKIIREHSWSNAGDLLDHVAESLVLVCPHCCKAWATLEIEGNPLFDSRMVPCHNHAPIEPFGRVPGSILTEEGLGRIDIALLEALPPELLKREFDLHIKHLSKESINVSPTINHEFDQLCFAGEVPSGG